MTKQELIEKGAWQVKGNPDLLSVYIDLFQEEFGYKPICAGCTFSSDWKKFINKKNYIKFNKMDIQGFKLKDNSKIYSFHNKEWQKNEWRRTERVYGNKMTNEWAKAYLTIGTDEEIEQRKSEFLELPKFDDVEEVSEVEKELSLSELRELHPEISARSKKEFLEKLNGN